MNPLARLLSVFLSNRREILYGYAASQVGRKKCFRAGPEFGCADAVNTVFKECFGNEIGGDVSTARLDIALNKSIRFVRISSLKDALRGDIVISPTGQGNGSILNGHVGILGNNGAIMSNNSSTGLWDTHLNVSIWMSNFVIAGGYPMKFYRIIA